MRSRFGRSIVAPFGHVLRAANSVFDRERRQSFLDIDRAGRIRSTDRVKPSPSQRSPLCRRILTFSKHSTMNRPDRVSWAGHALFRPARRRLPRSKRAALAGRAIRGLRGDFGRRSRHAGDGAHRGNLSPGTVSSFLMFGENKGFFTAILSDKARSPPDAIAEKRAPFLRRRSTRSASRSTSVAL